MKRLMKVVAVALVLAVLCMTSSPVMAAPTNASAQGQAHSAFGQLMSAFAAVWSAAVWNSAVWSSAVWNSAVWS